MRLHVAVRREKYPFDAVALFHKASEVHHDSLLININLKYRLTFTSQPNSDTSRVMGIWITVDDIRRHHCVAGIRRWMEANGLDWRAFFRDGGIDSETLLATEDALAIAVVNDAIRRRENPDG